MDNVRCKRCGSENWAKAGLQWRNSKKDVQRRRCKDCGRIFVFPEGHTDSKVKMEVPSDATTRG